jgi:hypothetical protein
MMAELEKARSRFGRFGERRFALRFGETVTIVSAVTRARPKTAKGKQGTGAEGGSLLPRTIKAIVFFKKNTGPSARTGGTRASANTSGPDSTGAKSLGEIADL